MRVVKRKRMKGRRLAKKKQVSIQKKDFKKIVATCMVIGVLIVIMLVLQTIFLGEGYNETNAITKFLTSGNKPMPKTKTELKIDSLTSENYLKDNLIADLDADNKEKQEKIQQLITYNETMSSNQEWIKLDYNKTPDTPMYLGNLIIRQWVRYGGKDWRIPLAICKLESNFDPLRRNHGTLKIPENSWGLFQINTDVHGGRLGYSNYNRLYNPVFNTDFQFPELVKFEKMGISNGLSGADLAVYVEKYGQRPYFTKEVDSLIRKYYKEFVNATLDF